MDRVRVVEWVNGSDVTLTVPLDGTPLTWGYSEATEEGWRSGGAQWSVVEDYLYVEEGFSETDCDGRLDSFVIRRCPITRDLDGHPRLKMRATRDDMIGLELEPAWERVDRGQRDWAAEAMGY